MGLKLLKRPKLSRPEIDTSRIDRPDYYGATNPEILFVVDPLVGKPDDDEPPVAKRPITKHQLETLTEYMRVHGIPRAKAAITWACPPVLSETWEGAKRLSDHMKLTRDYVCDTIHRAKPKIIVAMGKSGASQVFNRAAKITKLRGTPVWNDEFNCVVFPMFGLSHVIRIPDVQTTFNADMATLKKIVDVGYTLEYQVETPKSYKWVTDLSFLLKKKPRYLSVDIEGIGLRWYDPKSTVLTVQLCTEAGVVYCVPINYDHTYKGERDPERMWVKPADNVIKAKLIRQLKLLLEDPEVNCFGQNMKFDFMMLRAKLGITISNFVDDTILLSHAVDENLKQRNLDELTRLYIPELSGYADDFNRDPIHQKKTRMDLVTPDNMLMYGCGDSDSCFRLRKLFLEILGKDKAALNCYRRVVMPAVRAFCDVEVHGFNIDRLALKAFERSLRIHQAKEYNRLLAMVPATIKAEYIHKDKKWKASITRRAFLLQMLFYHKDGLRLRPRVFTKSTKNLRDHSARVPSVSTKDHLPYFEEHQFVAEMMQYIKNEKLLGTYVGTDGEDDDEGGTVKGFYKYIFDGKIRPSYLLHGTTTGRSASRDPNGQNFPKHGELAEKYRRVFVAPAGYVLIEVDFSQIELRIAAIMAREPTMLRLYREGADIHSATAAYVMGISLAEFMKLDSGIRKQKRFEAKAINFGFLYGMGWRKFVTYAKTTYKLDFTEEAAQEIRNAFFRLYRNLRPWHEKTRAYVQENGFVRAFDGRVRHLPNVYSPDEMIAQAAERQAINSPVQGFGSDLGLLALQLIQANVPTSLVRPIGFIHDAIVCIAPVGKAIQAAKAVKYWMEHIPLKKWFNFDPPIPIIAEPSIGKNLSEMIEVSDKWLSDNDIKTWRDVRDADWEARCAKAKADGKPLPPRPGTLKKRVLTHRPRNLMRAVNQPRPKLRLKVSSQQVMEPTWPSSSPKRKLRLKRPA